MCLDVKITATVKTADTDIVVYKMIKKVSKWKRKYITPFQSAEIKWHKILIETNPDVLNIEIFDSVEIGFHTFTNIEDVRAIVKKHPKNFKIAKCIIPKGSKYIEGTWDAYIDHSFCQLNSKASNQIKYLKIIK